MWYLLSPRRIIAFLGRKIYLAQYLALKESLLIEYREFQASQIHNHLLDKLLISGEDHRFRYHFGFDIIAIIRAINKRIFYKKIEGASTIEQQLVRILSNDFEKTFKRKLKEIFLATTLREIVPRKYIPGIYLKVAYYGADMNGLKQVYKRLKITNPKKISLNDCAEIIARIKYPQPKQVSKKRASQIEMRKNHLLMLYSKHNTHKFFKIYG